MTPRRSLAAAGVAALFAVVVLVPGGSDRGEARGQPSGPRVFVDRASRGGPCKDGYSRAQARAAARPWCTLERAAAAARPGDTVVVRGADYPKLTLDGSRRRGFVTFEARPGESVSLAGLALTNSGFMRFEGFRFTEEPQVSAGSRHVQLVGNRVENAGMVVGAGAAHVLLARNVVTNPSGNGLTLSSGPGEPPMTDVAIRGNRFDRIGVDAIQAKNFVRVRIEGNEFSNVVRAAPDVHPDVLQTVFGGRDLVFRNNVVRDSATQVVFLADGRVRGAVIENNLIVRIGGQFQAVQIAGESTGVRIVNNTIDKGVYIRQDSHHVILANNFLASLTVDDPRSFDYRDHNIIASTRSSRGGRHEVVGRRPRFTPAFDLSPGSLGVDAGTSDYAPATDRRGDSRVDDPAVRDRGTGSHSFVDIGASERQLPGRPRPLVLATLPRRQPLLRRRGIVRLLASCAKTCGVRARGVVEVGRAAAPLAGASRNLAGGRTGVMAMHIRRRAHRELDGGRPVRVTIEVSARSGGRSGTVIRSLRIGAGGR